MSAFADPVGCRLLEDRPLEGALNMAIDEVLLDSVQQTGRPTLRFYSWAPPTLSLGYFQPLDKRHSHSASLPCKVVRRSTGGGARLSTTRNLPTVWFGRGADVHREKYIHRQKVPHGCIDWSIRR